jgi:hypothetical protein
MRFKHLLLAIPLSTILFSCGVKRSYTFETDPNGNSAQRIALIDTDQLRLDFGTGWFLSSDGFSMVAIYLDLKNKCDLPFLIKDIAFEMVLHSNEPSPLVIEDIELLGLTKVDPIGGHAVPLIYYSFDQIEEVNRTLNPYLSVKDLKRFQFKIQTPSSYNDVSKSPDTIQLNVLLDVVQSGKSVQYKQKVLLYKISHRDLKTPR